MRSLRRKSKDDKGNAERPLLRIEFRERENVNGNVASLSENPHVREAPDDSTPIVPTPAQSISLPGAPLAEAGPCSLGVELAPPHASAASQPAASPAPYSCGDPVIDGISRELNALDNDALGRLIDELSRSRRQGDSFKLALARTLRNERLAATGIAALTPTAAPGSMGPSPARPPESPPLGSPPPKTPPPAPRPSILTLAKRCVDTAGNQALDELADRIAQDLANPDWRAFYRKQAQRVRDGEISPEKIAKAYRQAKCDGVRSPGSVFTCVVNRRE